MILDSTFNIRAAVLRFAFLLCAAVGYNAAEAKDIASPRFVVIIDPGHGGANFPGASRNGIIEKNLNLEVALKTGRLIEEQTEDIKVVYTRTTDMQLSKIKNTDLGERANIANRNNGDLFLSIHTNAVEDPAAYGTETFVLGESPRATQLNGQALLANNEEELIDMSDSKTAAIVRAYIQNLQFTYGQYSEMMARLVEESYADAGRASRGVKKGLLKVLYASDMPGVLTEIGFMSNSAELKFMCSESGQMKLAQALCNAVKAYFDNIRALQQADDEETPPASAKPAKETPAADTAAKPAAAAVSDDITEGYAIQLLASGKQIAASDSEFRAYRNRVDEYRTEGKFPYKYCYGRYPTRAEAVRALPEVKKTFKEAFVVKFRDGRIVK